MDVRDDVATNGSLDLRDRQPSSPHSTISSTSGKSERQPSRRRRSPVHHPPRTLGRDDDILTSCLVDIALGSSTHKMQSPPLEIELDRVALETTMLNLEEDCDLNTAFDRLFGSNAVVRCPGLDPEHAASDLFRAHAHRYLSCFLPDAGFAIVPCHRYVMPGAQGAKLVVTQPWSVAGLILLACMPLLDLLGT